MYGSLPSCLFLIPHKIAFQNIDNPSNGIFPTEVNQSERRFGQKILPTALIGGWHNFGSLHFFTAMANFLQVRQGNETAGLRAMLARDSIADRFGIASTRLIGLQLEDGSVISLLDGNGTDPQSLTPMTSRQIDWKNARKMSLNGGTGGKTGEREYIARPGIRIVSSAPVYNNSSYFYMGYLFEGESTTNAHTSYWLTASGGNQVLTFLFQNPVNVACIRVCATAHTDCTDRRSNYEVTVTACDGQSKKVTEGIVDTSRDLFGSFHTHKVQECGVIEIRFDLTQERSYGVCLKKIEIWSVE
jgi:hypothetical protein